VSTIWSTKGFYRTVIGGVYHCKEILKLARLAQDRVKLWVLSGPQKNFGGILD